LEAQSSVSVALVPWMYCALMVGVRDFPSPAECLCAGLWPSSSASAFGQSKRQALLERERPPGAEAALLKKRTPRPPRGRPRSRRETCARPGRVSPKGDSTTIGTPPEDVTRKRRNCRCQRPRRHRGRPPDPRESEMTNALTEFAHPTGLTGPPLLGAAAPVLHAAVPDTPDTVGGPLRGSPVSSKPTA
jgi:hypothetical protein